MSTVSAGRGRSSVAIHGRVCELPVLGTRLRQIPNQVIGHSGLRVRASGLHTCEPAQLPVIVDVCSPPPLPPACCYQTAYHQHQCPCGGAPSKTAWLPKEWRQGGIESLAPTSAAAASFVFPTKETAESAESFAKGVAPQAGEETLDAVERALRMVLRGVFEEVPGLIAIVRGDGGRHARPAHSLPLIRAVVRLGALAPVDHLTMHVHLRRAPHAACMEDVKAHVSACLVLDAVVLKGKNTLLASIALIPRGRARGVLAHALRRPSALPPLALD
mmetsp:Transcript_87522/g.203595  ORF Transcript_87522/g.203595 Transcript_87522/m.203595 type:complete len:274 (+) Transcript_87522:306-1127(+)